MPNKRIKDLRTSVEVIKLRLELQDLNAKLNLSKPKSSSTVVKGDDGFLYNSEGKRISRPMTDLSEAEQTALMLEYRGINSSQSSSFTEGNIMMEGPLDHGSGQSPTERFMQLTLDPYKIAILCRLTAVGNRVTFETASDALAGGVSLDLLGEGMDERETEVNLTLSKHYEENLYLESLEAATGAMRELGSSLQILHYEGEVAATIGQVKGQNVYDFGYMRNPAPEAKVMRIDVVSRLDFHVLEDDGKGHPLMFQAQFFLGLMSGTQMVEIHHSRCIHFVREKRDRSFEGTPVIQPCYNESVIITMDLKSMGEIAFRWAYGKPLILTKGLTDHTFTQFKNNLGNPTREAWLAMPSEWIEKFELLSNNVGNLDIPAFLDKLVDFCVLATGIPKAVMMGDVQGVNQDNTVDNQNFFAVLGKIHNNIKSPVLEYYNKDFFVRQLLQELRFEFNWGIRYSMSAEDKIDLETKSIANDVTALNFMTHNEVRAKKDLPPLEEVITNDPEYAKMLGNSLSSYTQFEKESAKAQIEIQRETATIKANAKTMGKTVLGNDGKGKGKGVKHGQGEEKQKIKQPQNKQTAKAQAISRVRNSIADLVSELKDHKDMKNVFEVAEALETNKDKIYTMIGWKQDEE